MRRLMLSMFACMGILGAAGCGTSVQVDSGFVILDKNVLLINRLGRSVIFLIFSIHLYLDGNKQF